MICILITTTFSFSGCTFPWWGTNNWGSSGTGNDSSSSGSSVPLPNNVAEEPRDYNEEMLQKEAFATQGVRSIYVPPVDDDLIMGLEKFLSNAGYQYEVVARYILHVLQGKYGAEEGLERDAIPYVFYPDEVINNEDFDEEEYQLIVDLPELQPTGVDENDRLLQSHIDAINNPVVNIKWTANRVNNRQYVYKDSFTDESQVSEPEVEQYTDSTYAWAINGYDLTTDYVHRIQLNLMEMGLSESGEFSTYWWYDSSFTEEDAQKKIEKLAENVKQLGVPQTSKYYENVEKYIINHVIGPDPMERETASITYTDLSYTFKIKSSTEGEEDTQYTEYYGMGGGDKTFKNEEFYKFGYSTAIEEILNAVLGEYDEITGLLNPLKPGFVAYFPDHTRAEAIGTAHGEPEIKDPVLKADRAKFFENAAYQYQLMSQYILHLLQGEYGSYVGGDTLTYEFYAKEYYDEDGNQAFLDDTFYKDKKIRNATDATSMTVTLPSRSPKTGYGNSRLLQTHENAINAPVVGIQWAGASYRGSYPADTVVGPPDTMEKRDESLHWNITGGEECSDIETTYLHRVQLNLMQSVLGVSITDPNSITEEVAKKRIKRLAKKIDKLGIAQNISTYNKIKNYIYSTIIGSELISREYKTLTYSHLIYTYTWEYKVQEGTKNVGTAENPKYVPNYKEWTEDKTGCYDLKAGEHSFSDSEIYKFNYTETVNEILNAVIGTFDSYGNLVEEGFVAEYPTYTRVEAIDSQPFDFYYATERAVTDADKGKINSMEYRNYNSVIMYPDASIDAELIQEWLEEKKKNPKLEMSELDYYNSDKKRWILDSVDISIESMEEITIDVYVRVHYAGSEPGEGSDTIVHLTRLNTDPEQVYYYSPPQDAAFVNKYTDSAGNAMPERYFDEEKSNNRSVHLEDLLPVATMNDLTEGIQNPYVVGEENKDKENFRQFYHEEQELDDENKDVPTADPTFHNISLGKLGSTVNVDTPRHLGKELIVTNFYGEEVDFSDKYLCQDDCDFVEYIFDVQIDPQKPADYDYTFRYSIVNTYFWGLTENASTEEQEELIE